MTQQPQPPCRHTLRIAHSAIMRANLDKIFHNHIMIMSKKNKSSEVFHNNPLLCDFLELS